MPKIIPAILAKTAQEFGDKIKTVEGEVDEIQIDIMDGKLAPNITFADPDFVASLNSKLNIELHLMVENPAEVIDSWKNVQAVRRATFHLEINRPIEPIIQKIKSFGWQVGIALNPETSIDDILPFITQIDAVLVMGVNPGFSGQEFSLIALHKIQELRDNAPALKIEVDGGVNETNIKEIITTGADNLIIASAIFGKPEPVKALKKLNSLIAESLNS